MLFARAKLVLFLLPLDFIVNFVFFGHCMMPYILRNDRKNNRFMSSK